MQSGVREGKIAAEKLSDFPDLSGESKEEIIRQLDLISIQLEKLQGSTRTSMNIAPASAVDELECGFKDTCYAFKSKTGECPCELHR